MPNCPPPVRIPRHRAPHRRPSSRRPRGDRAGHWSGGEHGFALLVYTVLQVVFFHFGFYAIWIGIVYNAWAHWVPKERERTTGKPRPVAELQKARAVAAGGAGGHARVVALAAYTLAAYTLAV